MTTRLEESINEMADIVHQNSVDHGFHNFEEDEGQFLTRALLLINTETAELFEAYRKHQLRGPCDKCGSVMQEPLTNLEEELADIVIRALDISKRMKVDIGRAITIKHAYNVTRDYRHGNKAA